MRYDYQVDKPYWLNHAIATITTNDLDPVYEAVHFAAPALGEAATNRFLVAMNLYYHIGLACKIAETSTEDTFWDVMLANYEGTKRGTERRYFRGAQGLRCLSYLKENFSGPSDFVDKMYRQDYHSMVDAFKPVPAFGEYFIWKWLDFYDRILSRPVAIDESCMKYVPKEPQKGAMRVYREIDPNGELGLGEKEVLPVMMAHMIHILREEGVKAPPTQDRLVGMQEVETCLCMLQHNYNGSDFVGKDIADKHEAIAGHGDMADEIYRHLPPRVAVDFFLPPAEVVTTLGIKLPPEHKALFASPKEDSTVSLLSFA